MYPNCLPWTISNRSIFAFNVSEHMHLRWFDTRELKLMKSQQKPFALQNNLFIYRAAMLLIFYFATDIYICLCIIKCELLFSFYMLNEVMYCIPPVSICIERHYCTTTKAIVARHVVRWSEPNSILFFALLLLLWHIVIRFKQKIFALNYLSYKCYTCDACAHMLTMIAHCFF